MKYRTFRNLVMLGGATVLTSLFGTCLYFDSVGPRSHAGAVTGGATVRPAGAAPGVWTVSTTNAQPQPAPNRAYGAPNAASPAQPQTGQRREDQAILNFLATRPATTDKVKDAFPGESFKVNLYRDGGGANWTRLKIDLDRDGKDDEKWDLQDGQPHKRHVSTRDDEQYDREYRWRNAQWVIKK